jgi:GNAT superfamily N-acetyltransferase
LRIKSPSSQLIQIGPSDAAWHGAFHRYIEQVFPRVSFRWWCELGGWNEDYRAFALLQGSEIVANASLQRMDVIVDGRELTAWQLGAVGVIPGWRGKGLQRQILPQLLETPGPQDLVFLFANENVLEFYPKFGFQRSREHLFGAGHAVTPSAQRWERLKCDRADHRALLVQKAATALPVTRRFGARNYASIALWYWTNFYADCFYYSEKLDALFVAEQEGARLRILDVFAPAAIDLAACLPHLISTPVSQLEFGFTPELLWPDAKPLEENTDSPLFIRGPVVLPTSPFGFPALAHT